ncbi:hypothetical protein LUW77_20560 [Streptomyces radiopugnans]|nr:hypothetical protein LUW77_20560 [Streptomyces radiopugnans]
MEFAPEATVTNDRFRGTKSYTYTARLTYGGGTGYEAGFLKGDHHGETARTGSMTVVRDDGTGELLRIVMTQTIETGGSGHKGGGRREQRRGGRRQAGRKRLGHRRLGNLQDRGRHQHGLLPPGRGGGRRP